MKQIVVLAFSVFIKYRVLTYTVSNTHKCQAMLSIIPISHPEN